ncbi:MAG: single-stranded-DNA-specific exonuclease RecJ [Gemmatimonadales bacterium]|nr:MAG: single-stranded-DNA-specific exonuclease RecJ [Gemmatimonadales bacterium]
MRPLLQRGSAPGPAGDPYGDESDSLRGVRCDPERRHRGGGGRVARARLSDVWRRGRRRGRSYSGVTSPAPAPGLELPRPPRPRWELAPAPDPHRVQALAQELHLPPALCRVLVARGIQEGEAARTFLRPLLDHLHPPHLLTDATRAARRILQAVEKGEGILVHGDYDVDGICSAALLTLWIRRLGGRVEAFVPDRLRDGYDLGPAGIERAEALGATLIVTCDSGIVAHDAVALARARGVDVVITDHHTPGETLPPAVAVVNPNRSDCDYPYPSLAGVGVAFKLCQLLGQMAGRPEAELLENLDLVALATVADLVPLTGENRVLVRYGLRVLQQARRPGVAALLEVTELAAEDVDAGKVGFVLAPRLNAAGRMGSAMEALELLLAPDLDRARTPARRLEALNALRRDEDARTLDEALERLAADYDPRRDFGVVVAGEGWHPGVIGIVASRIVERIHRPTVLLTTENGRARGSARSIPGVHLLDAVRAAEDHLVRFGGHRQAAGMDVETARIPHFREAFNKAVRHQLQDVQPRPRARGDVTLGLDEVSEELLHFLQYVGPFGIGNPEPIFWAAGVEVARGARIVGKGHLKLRLRERGRELEAIGFGLGHEMPPERLGAGPVDVLFRLRTNEFRGVRSLQAQLKDMRIAGDGTS